MARKPQTKVTVSNWKQLTVYNVLGRPRQNRWGTRFGWNVHLEHPDKAGTQSNMPITESLAAKIIKAKTGDTFKGFALINGKSKKITVHIYY